MIKPRKLPTQSRRSINNKSIEERKQNPKKDVNSEKAGNAEKKTNGKIENIQQISEYLNHINNIFQCDWFKHIS